MRAKNLLLLLTVLTFSFWSEAQEVPMDLIDRANAVEYIFEGQVLETHPYYTDNGQYIRTSNTVLITKILKGDIGCGTVEIITNGGELNGRELEISHSLKLHEGNMGLFLCDLTDRPLSVVDFYPEANLEKLEGRFENQSFVRYWWDGEELNAADIWLNFDSLALMYNLAELITGLTFIDCYPSSNSPIEEIVENAKKINNQRAKMSSVGQVTSFYPDTISGGTGEILTIEGNGFGNSGEILFPNANDGGSSQLFVEHPSAIIWNDSIIKLKIPSYAEFVNGTPVSQKGEPVGTGFFTIFPEIGFAIYPQDSLFVKYSVINHSSQNPLMVAPWAFMNKKFTFHCDTSVANYKNGTMKIAIQKAIDDWVCLTGIDWEIGTDITYNEPTALRDSICTISFRDFPDTVTTLAATSVRRSIDTSSNLTDFSYQIYEVDIAINSDKDWFCDTSQTVTSIPSGEKDFYAVILHELGHAHGLHHVINKDAIMHYKVNNQERIIDLSNDASCDEGGNWIGNRTNNLSNPVYGTSYDRMEFDSIKPCSHNISVVEYVKNDNFEVSIFPNPCAYNINIKLESYSQKDFEIHLYDIKGKLLSRQNSNKSESITFDTSTLENGTYILRLISDKGEFISSHKFIKL